jgi:hypothetical protein
MFEKMKIAEEFLPEINIEGVKTKKNKYSTSFQPIFKKISMLELNKSLLLFGKVK